MSTAFRCRALELQCRSPRSSTLDDLPEGSDRVLDSVNAVGNAINSRPFRSDAQPDTQCCIRVCIASNDIFEFSRSNGGSSAVFQTDVASMRSVRSGRFRRFACSNLSSSENDTTRMLFTVSSIELQTMTLQKSSQSPSFRAPGLCCMVASTPPLLTP